MQTRYTDFGSGFALVVVGFHLCLLSWTVFVSIYDYFELMVGINHAIIGECTQIEDVDYTLALAEV